jgi:hypothetical protein
MALQGLEQRLCATTSIWGSYPAFWQMAEQHLPSIFIVEWNANTHRHKEVEHVPVHGNCVAWSQNHRRKMSVQDFNEHVMKAFGVCRIIDDGIRLVEPTIPLEVGSTRGRSCKDDAGR